jgi:peptide/nickel transport system permease protein
MSATPPAGPAVPRGDVPAVTDPAPPASAVWRQFRKNRIAVVAWWGIRGLVVLAAAAPLVASDRPYVMIGGGPDTSPLLEALFDRSVFESGVDVLFNLLLLAGPPLLLLAWVCRLLLGRSWRRRRTLVWAVLAAAFTGLLVAVLAAPTRSPYRDLQAEIAARRARGERVWAPLPPIPYAYTAADVEESSKPPSRRHLLGTDSQGRDVLARLIYGTRVSLTIGVVAVAIYVAIGILLGSLAGYCGGWVDICISRCIEVMICFPTFFLILTIVGLIEHRSIFHIMAIIGLTGWTQVARLVRGEVLRIRTLDYVQAAIAQGIRRRRIIFRHVLPNAVAPVLVAATFGIASAILVESGLAFLGLGDPTVPSWGELLTMGRLEQRGWLILSPGVAIFVVVLCFNLVGEGLRDALDPRLRT